VPRPQRALIQTYEDLYRRLSPEEAEADLNETLSDPVKRQSPMARAKISAYGNVYPQLPTETTLAPTTPPVPEGTPPAAAQAPAPPGQELPAPAPVPQPPQAAPRQAPQTPQAQALLDRFVAAYDPLSDQELDREEARLQRGGAGMDVLSQYRLKAIDTIRARRQGPGGPLDPRPSPTPSPRSADSPAPSTRGTARQPQGLGEHQRLVEEYRGLTPTELSAESRRVLRSDPLTRKSETNFRLTVLNQLLTERKAAKPHGELVDEPTLQRYRDEVREWSTARLLEESHTLRGVLGSGLQVLTQLRPEAFAGVTRAARLAREAAALGGAVASAPGATAGLPFLAPLAWGITLKSLSAAVPEAGTWLRDTYHRQLAIALELHERLRPKTGGTTTDEAAD